MLQAIRNRFLSKKGQGMVEYAVILALIIVVTILLVKGIGTKASSALTQVNAQM